MTSGSNLKRRGAVLQSTLNTRELVRSLNTTDRRTSNIRKPTKLTKLAEWQDQFARLGRQRDITEGDFAVATWEHYSTELRFDEVERIVPAGDRATAGLLRGYQIAELRKHLGMGETVLIHWAADAYIATNQLKVEKGDGQHRELCFRMVRAQIEALQRGAERDVGNYAGFAGRSRRGWQAVLYQGQTDRLIRSTCRSGSHHWKEENRAIG